MMKQSLPAAVGLVLAAVSACNMQELEQKPTVQYVREILADRNSPEMVLLKRNSFPRAADDICLIGSGGSCAAYAALLSGSDIVDNVDASAGMDGLPDYAGETLSCIERDLDYRAYIQQGRTHELRTRCVREALGAIDTLAHISLYDTYGLGTKRAAKIIIFADAANAEYGKFDVDSLFASSGCQVRTIAPIDEAIDKAFAEHPGKPLRLGIFGSLENCGLGIYQERFRERAAIFAPGSECTVFATDTVRSRERLLREFIDFRLGSGAMRAPVDAIIVDDYSASGDELRLELADILSVMNESSMTYGQSIAGNFEFYDTREVAASVCYSILRKENLFTHNISLPQAVTYRVAETPDPSDDGLLLISSSYVQN